jgi:alanine-synthesizing transaminase
VTATIFATRTNWCRDENALSKVSQKTRENPDCIDLTISNPTRVGLAKIDVEPLNAPKYDPTSLGALDARKAIAEYYDRRDIEVPPERIILTASTSEAYGHLFRLLLNPGETILMPHPSYPLFDYLTRLADLEQEKYNVAYDGAWHIETSSFPERTKAVIVVSPNNPTGNFARRSERAKINTLQCPIISDEVFADYSTSHKECSWINNEKNLTFSLNGLSKTAGLPQHKLSWIVLSGPKSDIDEARSRLEIIMDSYLSVASGIQKALPAILDQVDDWQDRLNRRLLKNRRGAEALLRDGAITLRHSKGGWYAILQMPSHFSDEEWAMRLAQEEALIVHPGYFFEMRESSCLVLSLIVEADVFKTGIERIISIQERCTG